MKQQYFLNEIRPGDRAIVRGIAQHGSIRRRFLDIGLTDGATVECVGRSPLGDPAAYLIRGAVIAIRDEDSAGIRVAPIGREG